MGTVQGRAVVTLQVVELDLILHFLRNPKVIKSLDGQHRRRLTELIARLQTQREQAASSKVSIDDTTWSQVLRFLSGTLPLCKLLAALLTDSGQ